jgi:DNA-binding transcriptional LysR family regulator
MRLEWLDDILAVAETGSLTDAAERRGLTQSAFSRRIRLIEEHVGAALFDRSRKPLHLFAALEGQRDEIARLAADLRQLSHNLREGAQSAANRLVIVSQHALTAALAPALVEDMRGRDARVFVRLTSANLDECFAQLLARQADIAVVYLLPGTQHPVRPDFIDMAVIGEDSLIPVIGAGQEAEVRARIAEGELPYVAYPDDVFLGRVAARTILMPLRQRLRAVARAETALTLAAMELALSGVGVAWVPQSLARPSIEAGALADLSELLPSCTLQITAVRLRGPAERAVESAWSLISTPRV